MRYENEVFLVTQMLSLNSIASYGGKKLEKAWKKYLDKLFRIFFWCSTS